ncbi:Imm53 family immunity protein [Nonomuraea dietziae]|uniref:Imm53 family immunity protein n=1 Tax=Nonomuraea dietziae TaxID=65515 RepID=UPI0033C54AF9
MIAGPLTSLQSWYASCCDDDWEHSYGVTIGTLDNPGWCMKIDLVDTSLAGTSTTAREPVKSSALGTAASMSAATYLMGTSGSASDDHALHAYSTSWEMRAEIQPAIDLRPPRPLRKSIGD